MTTDYEARLRLPLEGNPSRWFFTRSGQLIAVGYSRVVIGDRGPYVEFEGSQMVLGSLREAPGGHYYYVELRTLVDNVKVYAQAHRVDYADYEPGMFYVSPFELYDGDGNVLIEPLRGGDT